VLAIIMSKHRRKLMKKGVTLLSALLFFAVMTSAAGIASDAVKIKKVKSLIASFKDSIKETSFSSDWQSSKAAWQNELYINWN
jgi:predicted histidine transporter YuiF (NhaC family)